MWNCSNCREQIEDSFDTCWNCGASKEGVVHPAFERVKETTVETPRELPECPKCHVRAVMQNCRVKDRFGGIADGELEVEVYEDSRAMIFKGRHRSILRAYICGNCGFTEFYVCDPKELLQAFRKSGSQAP